MITVAVISPFRFLETINKVITDHDFDCAFHSYSYEALSDIDDIYARCLDTCDIILFSGELGYHYMHRHYPNCPIPCAFTVYGTADVLSILLDFHLRHPGIPLNRLYLDFLTPQNHYLNLQDYLPEGQIPFFFEEDVYDYANITQRGSELWQEGKIDFVLSRSINNLKQWEKLGIPYEPVNPTEKMIVGSIEEALNRERLKTLQDTSVVTLIIHLPGDKGVSEEEREYRTATLYKFLVDFRKEKNLSYSIDHSFDRFVARATFSNDYCKGISYQKIMAVLRKNLPFPFSVGIGIHPSEQTSQYHAEQALLESTRYGLNEGFLVSGDPEVLTGPLSHGQSLRYSYQDGSSVQFAHRLGIDNTNLLRLVALYRNDPKTVLTAAELGPILGITQRSTRRILQRLFELGLVRVLSDTGTAGRGRPVHKYVFNPDAMEHSLAGIG